MVARRPYVRTHARTRWSDDAFEALYGLEGQYGVSSVKRAGSSNARSPYTSSVLMWWKRTSCCRAASNSRIVPSTFVRMNGSGLAMELSLCDSAAKWTMAS
ncbi:unknown [Bifidobacterium bifidum CAG:234]|nr:unknown [Bifidobacterium bifidum CAG:234]